MNANPTRGSLNTDGLRIDHLGIAVNSIASSRAFYQAMGLAVAHEETVEHEGVRTALLPIGESRIELIEPLAEDSPVGRFLHKRGEGLHHIAFHVDDIAATLDHLRARGVQITSPAVQVGAGGHLYFFVHPRSAGGVLVEICQDVPSAENEAEGNSHGTSGMASQRQHA